MDIEKELKVKLSEKEYNHLLKLVKIIQSFNQINHFYDTKEYDLYNKKTAFRIREQEEKFIMTLKVQRNKNDGITVSEEYNKYLDDIESLSLKDIIVANFIKDSHIPIEYIPYLKKVVYLGKIENFRTKIDINGVICDIDKTIFNDKHIEFELECEDTDKIKVIKKFLEDNKIDCNNSSISKYARFISFLNNE